jgi:hypothetical protein
LIEARQNVYLKYFEGTPKSVLIDNKYINKVEADINSAFEKLENLVTLVEPKDINV